MFSNLNELILILVGWIILIIDLMSFLLIAVYYIFFKELYGNFNWILFEINSHLIKINWLIKYLPIKRINLIRVS